MSEYRSFYRHFTAVDILYTKPRRSCIIVGNINSLQTISFDQQIHTRQDIKFYKLLATTCHLSHKHFHASLWRWRAYVKYTCKINMIQSNTHTLSFIHEIFMHIIEVVRYKNGPIKAMKRTTWIKPWWHCLCILGWHSPELDACNLHITAHAPNAAGCHVEYRNAGLSFIIYADKMVAARDF